MSDKIKKHLEDVLTKREEEHLKKIRDKQRREGNYAGREDWQSI